MNLKTRIRELAARSGRIIEFGDANEVVLRALKAVASADETPAQRATLLKRGLIEMVRGQVVINERGYEMMQKAGVPPKLTPEERREEIAGTEEKRLSRKEFAWPKKVLPMGGGKLHFSRASYDALLARNPSLAKKIAEGSDSKWSLSGITRHPANDEVRGIFQKYWGKRLQ
jgi:hypothetical protein